LTSVSDPVIVLKGGETMATFWQLLRESVILQAVLALLFSSVVACMYLQGRQVPSELSSLLGIVIGFYFGSKSQLLIGQTKGGDYE
jgi:hypothetical protein